MYKFIWILLFFSIYPQTFNWVKISDEHCSSFCAVSDSLYYLQSTTGFFKSTNKGINWQLVSTNLPAGESSFLQKSKNDYFYYGYRYSNFGIYRTKDSINSWENIYSGTSVPELFIDSLNNLFANTGTAIIKSTNDGTTWTTVFHNQVNSSNSFFIDKQNSIFVLSNNKFFRSTNSGVIFTDITPINRNPQMCVYTADNNTIFLIMSTEILISHDGGNTWGLTQYFDKSSFAESIKYFTLPTDIIFRNYADTHAGGTIFDYSNDAMKTWHDVDFINSSTYSLSFLAYDNDKYIYIGFININGLYKSNLPFGSISDLNEPFSINGFALYQNYPNPFNPITKIMFDVTKTGNVELKVYDILGKEIAVLLDEEKAPGKYSLSFDGINLPSGIYLLRLKSGDNIQSKKMILMK